MPFWTSYKNNRARAGRLIRLGSIAMLLGGTSAAYGAPYVYQDTTAGAIPDTACASSLTRTFAVSETFTVFDVQLGLNLSHATRGQLRVTLQSPTGTLRTIVANSTDSFDNYDVFLTDSVTSALNDGNNDSTLASWYDRDAAPSTSFAAFDGEAANGNWTLSVCDVTGGTAGTFNNARLIFDGAPATPAPAAGIAPIQTFYAPYPEDQVFAALNTMYPGNAECAKNIPAAFLPAEFMHSYASVSTSSPTTVIYYDHWEDGFEFDITNPIQGSTEIWGDGNPLNGAPPGVPSDRLSAGTTIVLREDTIDVDTMAAVIDFDGGDKIASTEFISVTRSMWASGSDTLFAGALEMYDVSRWGTSYTIPVGEDLTAVSQEAFEYVGVVIQASDNATTISIDDDGDGTVDSTVVLDEGETHVLNGGVDTGATISATAPIQVNMITGDVCATYEARWFTLFPDERLSDSVFIPVGSYDINGDGVVNVANNDVPTEIWVHNPNDTAITVEVDTATGSSNLAVPANSTVGFIAGPDTATHLYTNDGSNFIPIVTIDSDDNVGTTGDESSTNDWGFAAVPEGESYQQLLVGLGFGNDPTKSGFDENSSPVWITAARSDGNAPVGAGLDVCIDYGGDNEGPLYDPGIQWNYDLRVSLGSLESYTIAETDGDQTGMYVFICDTDPGDRQYAILSGAWGQDPSVASGGSPAIDVGTTVPNLQNVFAEKLVDLTSDVNGDNLPNVGDTLQYQIVVTQVGQFPLALGSINFIDNLPPEVDYIPNTTEEVRRLVDGSETVTPIPDNGVTPFPLDESGHDSTIVLPIGGKFILRFDVTIVTLPKAPDTILNEAIVSSANYAADPEVVVARFVAIGDTVWLDSNGDGVQNFGEPGLPGVTLQLLECDNDGTNCAPYDSDPLTPGVQSISTTTDSSGYYIFDGLPSGTFSTIVTGGVPAGLALTTADDPGYPGDNSDPAVIGTASMYTEADFGFGPIPGTAIVGDFIWSDGDNDGVQDPGEPGLPGVTVELYDPGPDGIYGNADDAGVIATTTTDASGNYLFSNVTPGDYVVQVDDASLPVGSTITSGPQSSSDPSNVFVLNAGDVDLTVDFGYDVPGTFSISNTVWLDEDNDGNFDGTESPIAGVTVNLLDALGNIVATTVTDADGDFSFSGLADGDYTVQITDTADNLLGLAGTTPEAVVWSMDVTVAGGDESGEDFGYNRTGSIGDFVWSDGDGDGVQDSGEPGLDNVTVELWDLGLDGVFGGGDDTLVGTQITDPSGYYQFVGLSEGTYGVVVTDDNGVTTGATNTGDPDGGGDSESIVTLTTSDHDANPATPDVVTSSFSQDFGYFTPSLGSISGTVFNDIDGDGIDDGSANGEDPLDGITINLTDPGPDGIFGSADDTIIATTTTDSNGAYSFTGLPVNETYFVDVVDSSVPAWAPDHTTDNDPSSVPDPAPQAITLTPATPDVGTGDTGGPGGDSRVDFGYGGASTTPITLGSFVARPVGDGSVRFRWSTVTEVGNLGFNLYQKIRGKWRKLNAAPLRSKVIDSVEVTHYGYTASNIRSSTFAIVDVDLRGKQTVHGPFELNEPYGGVHNSTRRTDWKKIRSAAASKRQERSVLRRARLHRKAARVRQRARLRERRLQRVAAQHAGTSSPEVTNVAGVMNLKVVARGVHRVTFEQLVAAGLDLDGVGTDRLAIGRNNISVPIFVSGSSADEDVFGAGAFIEFVADPKPTIYAKHDVYSLVVDDIEPVRIATVDSAQSSAPVQPWYMETTRMAPETDYSFSSPTGDPWFASRLLAWGSPLSRTFEISLDHFIPGAATSRLGIDMWGVTQWPTDNDHHVRVSLNNVEVTDTWFDGLVAHPVDEEIAAGVLTSGVNEIKIELPLDTGNSFDLVNLDSWQISYPRAFVAREGALNFESGGERFQVHGLSAGEHVVYRIDQDGRAERVMPLTDVVCHPGSGCSVEFSSGPGSAEWLVADAEGILTPELVAPVDVDNLTAGTAEYLVISHPDFIEENLARLVAAREANGYTVKVVDVQQIYAAFGNHRVDANAIHAYIKHAAEYMGTRMVLLVGGDTYDYHDYLRQGAVSFMPSLYVTTDPVVRFAPSDPAYADTNGDGIPDLAIGRLPVRSAAELEAVVNKTLQYAYIDYAGTSVFAADAYDAGQQYSFTDDAEAMINGLPQSWSSRAKRLYVDDLGVEGATALLKEAINGESNDSTGVALVSYVGHSGPSDWSFQGLFGSSDASSLTNHGRPTVVTQWGCWNTYYVAPSEDTMGHAFMLGGDNGAAAVLGASTLTEAHAERAMAIELYARMLRPGVPLGIAVLNAKRAMAQQYPNAKDVILGWTLLGDPALLIEQ